MSITQCLFCSVLWLILITVSYFNESEHDFILYRIHVNNMNRTTYCSIIVFYPANEFLLINRDFTDSLKTYRYTSRLTSVLSIDDPIQRVRQQNLVARFNDMFAQDRLDALDTLRRYSDDHENNQRIVFTAISVRLHLFMIPCLCGERDVALW